MIVYAGKQRWNNFNNWDEALFQDANRPRDNDMFKIQAWINARKQDLRTANSWIAAQWTFRSYKMQDGGVSIVWNTAPMRNKFQASDLGTISFRNAGWYSFTEHDLVGDVGAIIIGRPYVSADGSDIIVWKSGVYAVTCACLFNAPYSSISKITATSFGTGCAAYYKFYTAFLVNWQASLWTESRWCWSSDVLTLSYIWWLDVWDRVNVGFCHTDTSDTFLCHPSINLYRLS